MTKVNVNQTINASANDTWKTISSFEGIENFSPVARSTKTGDGVGALRSCFLPDDAEIKEELPTDLPSLFISSVAQQGITELKDLIWKKLNE